MYICLPQKLDRSKRRVNRQGEPKRRLKRSASFEEFSSVSTDWADPFGASKVPRLDSSAVSLHPGAFVGNSFTTSRNIVNGTQFSIVKNFDVLCQVPAASPETAMSTFNFPPQTPPLSNRSTTSSNNCRTLSTSERMASTTQSLTPSCRVARLAVIRTAVAALQSMGVRSTAR